MEVQYRIAQLADVDNVFEFAEERLKQSIPDDMERMIKIWESRFRKEALNHYLNSGWSFVAYTQEGNKEVLNGFFLGQPLLFFEGHTQTLWIEDVQANNSKIKDELVEIAYKLSRDKHLQRVILPLSVEENLKSKNIKHNKQDQSWIWCKTTK